MKLTTEALIEVIKTRIRAEDGNPTGKSFFYELVMALERLKEYEEESKER